MPLPANVSTVVITGAYVDIDGTAAVGEVYIDAVPDYVLDASAAPPTTIGLDRYKFVLDADGEIPAGSEIIATDDADLNPTGWTYKVVVNLRSSGKRIEWYMAAPAASSPIDLTLAAPVDSDMGTPTVVGPPGSGMLEASSAEAIAGTSSTTAMTPRRTADTTVRSVPSASAGGRNTYLNSAGVTLGTGVSDCVVMGGTTSNPNVVGDDVALAVIVGGYDHEIVEGIASTICGGGHHVADATAGHAFIGGGSTQIVHGAYGVAVGGLQNTTHSGPYNTVGGGRLNVAGASADDTKSDNTVAGGYQNTASGIHSSIGGGQLNTSSGTDSHVGGGRSNTASGLNSTVAGGVTNTVAGSNGTVVGGTVNAASGDYSIAGGGGCAASNFWAVALGDNNTASGIGSVALGQRAVASLQGKMTYANGQFAAIGDAQTSTVVARRQTTTATTGALGLSGSAGSGPIALPDNTTWMFEISLVARRTDADNESAGYKFEGVIDRNTGVATTALVGTVTKTVVAEDTAAWDADVVADTTNGALRINVTGEASKTINWVARIELVEVTG